MNQRPSKYDYLLAMEIGESQSFDNTIMEKVRSPVTRPEYQRIYAGVRDLMRRNPDQAFSVSPSDDGKHVIVKRVTPSTSGDNTPAALRGRQGVQWKNRTKLHTRNAAKKAKTTHTAASASAVGGSLLHSMIEQAANEIVAKLNSGRTYFLLHVPGADAIAVIGESREYIDNFAKNFVNPIIEEVRVIG